MKYTADKKPTKRERAINDYNKNKDAVKMICEDCGFSLEEAFPNLAIELNETSADAEFNNYTCSARHEIGNFIKEHVLDDWKKTIEKNYDEDQKNSMFSLIETMLRTDPACIYECMRDCCKLLKSLENEKTRNKATAEIEDLCQNMYHEDFINKYSLLLTSKYRIPILSAVISGFLKNERIMSRGKQNEAMRWVLAFYPNDQKNNKKTETEEEPFSQFGE